jgi:5-formyltetrahydrofolate cyclo-ligase
MFSRRDLRLELRKRRSALSKPARERAAQSIARRLALSPRYRLSRRIAVYLAVNGEIDCTPLIRAAHRQGKHIFLPCIQPDGHMRFRRWTPATPMRRNRFGILEPHTSARGHLPPQALDMVFMPLVGFDPRGNRLGMGGGYYDRTFAWLRHRPLPRSPHLIGLAHDFQFVRKLHRAYWDVRLDGAVTPSRTFRFFR